MLHARLNGRTVGFRHNGRASVHNGRSGLHASQRPLSLLLSSSQLYIAPYTAIPIRGAVTPSFTRAGVKNLLDFEGREYQALSGEWCFWHVRRVRNLLADSNNIGNAPWSGGASTTKDAIGIDGATSAWTCVDDSAVSFEARSTAATLISGNQYVPSWYVGKTTGAVTFPLLQFIRGAADYVGVVVNTHTGVVTAVPSGGGYVDPDVGSLVCEDDLGMWRVSFKTAANGTVGRQDFFPAGSSNGTTVGLASLTGSAVFTCAQVEDVTGQSVQTASEYVSVGVESAPAYHGSMVDGVKTFPTDYSGNPLPTSESATYPMRGHHIEQAATNYLGVTDAPATQTTASLATGTYTLWCAGTGSCIASAGTATITGAAAASAGAPDQFAVTVAGTVTVTVTGSLTRFQLEKTDFATSYIRNIGAAGTSVTRPADVLSHTGALCGQITSLATSFWRPVGVATAGAIVSLSNGTANEYSSIGLTSATAVQFSGVDGGAAQWATTASNAYTPGTQSKVAQSAATNSVLMDLDGTAQTPDTTATMPTYTTLQHGHLNGASQINGAVGPTFGWIRLLSQSELTAIDK